MPSRLLIAKNWKWLTYDERGASKISDRAIVCDGYTVTKITSPADGDDYTLWFGKTTLKHHIPTAAEARELAAEHDDEQRRAA